MRVAFLIPVFPELHNTFILNQITGLIDRGVDLDLYPLAVGSYESAHAEVSTYQLRDRDKHITVPAAHLDRVVSLGGRLIRPRYWKATVMSALNPFGGRRALSLVPAYTAASFAKEKPYDIIHAQFGNLAPLALRLIPRSVVPTRLVVSFRGADTTSYLPKNRGRFESVFARGDLFLPVSDDLRERLIAAGSPPARTVVHRSGIDLGRFEYSERGRAEDDPTEVLFVGRFVRKKGIQDAIAAFARTVTEVATDRRAGASGATPRLTLIGSGPLETDLRTQVESLGLTQSVRFLGSLDADGVARAMRSAHVLIAPSVTAESGDKEGVPNVIKEAMATGLPVLSTRHGGIPELVEDGLSGFLVDEHDVEGLSRRLTQLITSPESWASIGRAGRAKVEAEYDMNLLNDLLVERYRGLLSTGGRSPVVA